MRVHRVFVLVLTLVMAVGVLEASAADCLLPPTLSMIAPAVGIAGTALNISITVKPTTGGRNCAIRSWTLAYGDGQTKTGTNKGTFVYAHTYATAATFTIQLSATTRAGKYAAITRTIVINIAQFPSFVVTCPDPMTVASPDGNAVAVSYTATTTGGTAPITIAYTPASGSDFIVGRTSVAVVATSSNGQTSSCAFTVTVTYTAPAGGFTYYVSTSGNDINTCTQARSLSTPRKTIAQGVACMGPGDRLLMRAGTYTSTSPTIVVPSGVSWNAATWIGRYGTESVILSGNPFKTLSAVVAYVIFDGFVIDGGAQRVDGVSVGQGSDHLRFSNIEVRNVASNGFTIAGTDIQIINCYIHDGGTTDFDDAIYLSGNQYGVSHNAIVSGTTITKWSGAAIYLLAPGYSMDDSTISGNTIYATSGGVSGTTNTNTGGYTNGFRTQGIVVQDANRTLVYNNLIYALRARTTPRYAILVGNAASGAKVMNNTVANNPTEGIELYQTSGSTLVVNNILSANTLGNVINQTTGVTFTTNACPVSGAGCDASLVGSPAFVNDVIGDYHIQAGSKAHDTGTTQGDFAVDKDGVARPQGGIWDVGAYEFNSIGTTYYVSTSGSDSNSCTAAKNIATPKRNIAGALGGITCLTAAAGDILDIRAGTYADRITTNTQSIPAGTSYANAATIRAHSGEIVIFNVSQPVSLSSPAAYLIFKDLIFDGADGPNEVVWVGNGAHHIRFTNVEIRNNAVGNLMTVNPDGSFIEFVGGRFHGAAGYCFYFAGTDSLIDGADVYSCVGYGIHIYVSTNDHPGASSDRNTVRNSRVHNITAGASAGNGILLAVGTGNKAYNNLVYDNAAQGIESSYGSNSEVYNNTVVGNGGYGVTVFQSTNTIIRNNILYQNTSGSFSNVGSSTFTINTNLCGTSGTGCAVVGDPLFVDASSKNYHLGNGSPAIDVGATITLVATDFDGVTRPQGVAYDIGAYER